MGGQRGVVDEARVGHVAGSDVTDRVLPERLVLKRFRRVVTTGIELWESGAELDGRPAFVGNAEVVEEGGHFDGVLAG